MARSGKGVRATQNLVTAASARSKKAAKNGIADSYTFRQVMLGLMGDLIDGKVHPTVSNAVCAAGRNVLQSVDMEYKLALKPGPAPKRFALTA